MSNENMIVDKVAYQSNRRKMTYIALGLIASIVIAMIVNPEKYGSVQGFDMALLSLSGIVGFYFGSTAWQSAKR